MSRKLGIHTGRLMLAFGLAAACATAGCVITDYEDVRSTSEKLSYSVLMAAGRTPDSGEICALESIAHLQARFSIASTYVLPVTSYLGALKDGLDDYLPRAHINLERSRDNQNFSYIIEERNIVKSCGLNPPSSGISI